MPSFSSMFAPDTVQDPESVDDGTSDTGGSAPAENEELAGPQSSESDGEGPAGEGDAFVGNTPDGEPSSAPMDDGGF